LHKDIHQVSPNPKKGRAIEMFQVAAGLGSRARAMPIEWVVASIWLDFQRALLAVQIGVSNVGAF
jgi:hypothetical protein